MTCGYYNAPEGVNPIDDNGYLHTGDLGFLDAEGYLHLSGRIKDIIIKGGETFMKDGVAVDLPKWLMLSDMKKEVKVKHNRKRPTTKD